MTTTEECAQRAVDLDEVVREVAERNGCGMVLVFREAIRQTRVAPVRHANGTHLIRMAGSGSGLRPTGKAISGITGGPEAETLFGLRVRVNVFMSSADRTSIACRLKWAGLLQPRIRSDVSLASLRLDRGPPRKVG